jgi:hypothetical protein
MATLQQKRATKLAFPTGWFNVSAQTFLFARPPAETRRGQQLIAQKRSSSSSGNALQ